MKQTTEIILAYILKFYENKELQGCFKDIEEAKDFMERKFGFEFKKPFEANSYKENKSLVYSEYLDNIGRVVFEYWELL